MGNEPNFVNFNGAILRSDKAILTADNRSFRYGDGLFETIKVNKGRICLENYHFERLMSGIRLLQFEPSPLFTAERLAAQIRDLCERNSHSGSARVRLVVFRGNGGLYDLTDLSPHYVIQSWSLAPETGQINDNGLIIDLFPDGRKACDNFSNLKSNNYLVYAMAALYARNNRLDDCLILNSHDRIAESAIANLFYFKQGAICTPPLSEGCVAGVMRRFLTESLPKMGFTLSEKLTTAEDLQNAEGLFLTNAVKGIQWVKSFRGTSYSPEFPQAVYQQFKGFL